jgi:RimJ/RimL family protein N-acetyltransferase
MIGSPPPSVVDPETGLPVGPLVSDPSPAPFPKPVTLEGRFCRLEPLSAERHAADLWRAVNVPDAKARHAYLFEEPQRSEAEVRDWAIASLAKPDLVWSAVIDKRSGRCEGRQTLMRIAPAHRCIEVGSIYWGPAISKSVVSTEALFLIAQHVFDDLGYRRFEWKCNALNAPSRAAALRFGFSYEGRFERDMIIKGRSRDTTWYAMTFETWPEIRAGYRAWLAPDNMGADGVQKRSLSAFVPRGRETPLA